MKKCPTVQSFVRKEVTSYKICIICNTMSFFFLFKGKFRPKAFMGDMEPAWVNAIMAELVALGIPVEFGYCHFHVTQAYYTWICTHGLKSLYGEDEIIQEQVKMFMVGYYLIFEN